MGRLLFLTRTLLKDQKLSPAYENLYRPMLASHRWRARGNVPALVSLMQAFVKHAPQTVVNEGLEKLLGAWRVKYARNSTRETAARLMKTILLHIPK